MSCTDEQQSKAAVMHCDQKLELPTSKQEGEEIEEDILTFTITEEQKAHQRKNQPNNDAYASDS